MKHLISILLLTLFSLSAIAQDSVSPLKDIMRYKGDKVVFEEVVTVPDVTASQLYGKAKVFFATTFKSTSFVVQSEDSENNTIVGKGTIVSLEDQGAGGSYYYFTLQIQAKDGKYRYIIMDMVFETTGFYLCKFSLEDAIKNCKEKGFVDIECAQGFYKDFTPLIKQIKKQIKIDKDDNW